MKKALVFIISFFTGIISIKALSYGGCEYKDVARMKSFVNNINLTYDYTIINNEAYFDVTISNITSDMYFVDVKNNITYYYNNTINGEITIKCYTNTSGSYKFYSANPSCSGISLGTKYYKFPIYNIYFNNEMCNDYKNISICQKWVNKSYSYDEFAKQIEDYKNSLIEEPKDDDVIIHNPTIIDKIIDIYVRYYYIFLIAIIVLCSSIIIIKRKKDKFNL